MPSTVLHSIIRGQLNMSDEQFGALFDPPIARSKVRDYRMGMAEPRLGRAIAIVKLLRARGINIEFENLLTTAPPTRKRTG